MKKILLNDLLNFSEEESKKVRVKFIQDNGYEDPADVFKNDPKKINEDWLFWRTKRRYFSVGQIAVSLLKIGKDSWLLTTVKEVTKELNITGGINYEGKELDEYSGYFGRVVVKYHKTVQQQCRQYEKIQDELEIYQILPENFS
ncbi:MAG: hypothetical protein ACRDD2_03370 [Sarcina sp.]